MRFPWVFFAMLENDNSVNKVLTAYHFKYLQNNQIRKSWDCTNPPDLPTLKAYPTPGVSGRFEFFSLKWRERMNLKDTRSYFSPLLRIFEHQGENCLGGCYNRPLRRTRVNPNPPLSNKIQQGQVKKMRESHYVIEAGIIWAWNCCPCSDSWVACQGWTVHCGARDPWFVSRGNPHFLTPPFPRRSRKIPGGS